MAKALTLVRKQSSPFGVRLEVHESPSTSPVPCVLLEAVDPITRVLLVRLELYPEDQNHILDTLRTINATEYAPGFILDIPTR